MKIRSAPERFGNVPLRSLTIVVPAGSRMAFLSLMDKFADAQKFSKRIRSMDPELPQFSVDLWRDDVGVFGANILTEQEFDFGIYVNTKKPISNEAADKLVEALSAAAKNVPGVSVSLKQK